jgi:hypothetical protein
MITTSDIAEQTTCSHIHDHQNTLFVATLISIHCMAWTTAPHTHTQTHTHTYTNTKTHNHTQLHTERTMCFADKKEDPHPSGHEFDTTLCKAW